MPATMFRGCRRPHVATLLVVVVISTGGCATDDFENVYFSHLAADGSLQRLASGRIEEALRIVDEVAREFVFERAIYSPAGQKATDEVHRRWGIALARDYTRDAPRAYFLLHVTVMDSYTEFIVSVRTLRGGVDEGELVRVRDEAARRIQERMPDWTAEFESGEVEVGFAP